MNKEQIIELIKNVMGEHSDAFYGWPIVIYNELEELLEEIKKNLMSKEKIIKLLEKKIDYLEWGNGMAWKGVVSSVFNNILQEIQEGK